MKHAFFGFLAALGLHAFVILFGGILIPKPEQQQAKKELIEVVELDKKEEKKEEEPKEKLDDPVEDVKQEMPDFRELNQPTASAAPALAAVSLSDLGSALSGIGGEGGGFGAGVGFGSGVIGGTPGGGGSLGGGDMLSSSQLDSLPQPTNRASPRLSADLRKQIKGKVELILIIGKDGAVQKAEVVSTPNPAANAACIEAARQWRFQPGSRGGKPVQFKLKLPFRFD